MKVDVIHLSEYLMERQLDQTAGKMLQTELENQGINFLLGKQTQEIFGENDVTDCALVMVRNSEADLWSWQLELDQILELAK